MLALSHLIMSVTLTVYKCHFGSDGYPLYRFVSMGCYSRVLKF